MQIQSFLFDKIDTDAGYAIPNDKFWELWHSEKQDAVRRAKFIPKQYGKNFGESCDWVVLLPHRVNDYVERTE